MDKLQESKINYNLLNEFPGAKRLGNGVYRVNPCPKCGGKDHFTLFEPNSSKNRNSWWTYSSFNGCCNGGSVVDYLIEFKGMSKDDAIKELTSGETSSSIKREVKNKPIVADPKEPQEKNYDFSQVVGKLYSQCTSSEGINYYKSRGFTHVIEKYKLGYSIDGYNAALKDYPELNINHTNQRAYKYFIPLLNSSDIPTRLIARHDNSINEKQKTWNIKGVSQLLFNQRYLETPINDKFIFICEGWADALSFEEVGRKAIALNSTQMANRFIQTVKNNLAKLKNKIFIIALDTDGAGANATKVILSGLSDVKLTTKVFDIPGKYKDVNEFLVDDRQAFEQLVKSTEEEVIEGKYKFTNGANLFNELLSEVEYNYTNGGIKHISTGFPELDRKIGGGLYNGLYIIGAGSSIGKTTFTQQIADHIASEGRKVLFFSLEMGKKEMISKTVVRELFKNKNSTLGAREFLNGDMKDRDWENLSRQCGNISKVLENIFYLEGNFGTTIEDIVNTTREFKDIYGEAPIVIVDYLQVIAPIDVRIGDKQNVDRSIAELKRLSRDLDTPVITISSVNRQNYLSYIDFTAFKDSGSIEFGADVVLGLQLNVMHQIMNMKEGQINEKRKLYNEAKAKIPREIEVVILKNRYGAATGTHNYNYHPKFNLFEELEDTFKSDNISDTETAISLFD